MERVRESAQTRAVEAPLGGSARTPSQIATQVAAGRADATLLLASDIPAGGAAQAPGAGNPRAWTPDPSPTRSPW